MGGGGISIASVRDVENAFSALVEAPIVLQTLQAERLPGSDEPIIKKVFQTAPKADALGQVAIVSASLMLLLSKRKESYHCFFPLLWYIVGAVCSCGRWSC